MIPFLKMLCQINKFQHAIIPIEMDRRGSHADYFGRKGTWKRNVEKELLYTNRHSQTHSNYN